jgi:hypothetical protein
LPSFRLKVAKTAGCFKSCGVRQSGIRFPKAVGGFQR